MISKLIHSQVFCERHKVNDRDFTRSRTLTFPRLVSFMLNMVKGSLQVELDKFFEIESRSHIPCRGVTDAAYCLARKKLSYAAFIEIRDKLSECLYESSNTRLWMGHRLLAVDGSSLTLPGTPNFLEHFGKANPHAVHATTRISQLYDILNKQTVDFRHAPFSTGERALAALHLEYAKENDLVLYDRGYAASWLFTLHEQHNSHFLARVKTTFSNQIEEFSRGRSNDKTIWIDHPQRSRRKCKELDLSTGNTQVRLVKFKLETGEVEILATSLMCKHKYPVASLMALYHQRWFVEEDYKIMKSRMEFENLTGKSPETVLQDIYAKVVTKNIAGILMIEAEQLACSKVQTDRALPKINFSYLLSKLKGSIVNILFGYRVDEIITTLIEQCSKQTHADRPGRRAPRNMTKMKKLRFFYAYKRTT